jgi:hypothetical protein
LKAVGRKLLVGLRNTAREFAPVSIPQRPIYQSQHLGLIVGYQDSRQPRLGLHGMEWWA